MMVGGTLGKRSPKAPRSSTKYVGGSGHWAWRGAKKRKAVK